MPVARSKRKGGKGNGKGRGKGGKGPAGQQSRVKLSEIGPRLTLELFRVEAGLCSGDVLYHRYVTKSAEEVGCFLSFRVASCWVVLGHVVPCSADTLLSC